MIVIKRPPAPDFLIKADSKWARETREAIAHYAVPGQQIAFDFKVYNDAALKAELKKVFTKCAYCESIYAATSDGDIEHFRPKGKVSGKTPETPGYYWLANDWDNLLLSCSHCNQGRVHQIFNEPTLRRQGKLDQFPLSNETLRVQGPGSLAVEETARLLINPCFDDPVSHFAYDDLEGVIIPLTPMAKASVDVYALQRKLLVDARKKELLDLFVQIKRVKRLLERMNTNPSAANDNLFEEEFAILKKFAAPESLYAGMARFFVRQFLTENSLI